MKCKLSGCNKECHIGKEYCLEHYKEHGEYVYGIDAELKKKMAGKLDMNKLAQAQAWIETLSGERFNGDFQSALKSGVLLCRALNAIKPNTVRKISTSSMPFNQRENIVQYLEGCKRLGQKEVDLFVSQDLFEGDNIGAVVNQIHSLGGLVQATSWYKGPRLGVKLAKGTKTSHEVGKSHVVPKLMQGSYGVQDETRNPMLDRQIIRDHSGHHASGDVPMQNRGAVAVEKEIKADKIIKNVDQLKANTGAAAAPKFCGGCGSKRAGNAKFCPSCGNKF